ncbi:type II 3-dehydroquinate dehydratase [Facklamia sp. DSM 111018]|uniref:3-dehydroquinate dehydratase n=1 Tax=Facklamia lactis TaxID=2749967 RepID=A0ABS0LP76_9LACT|nr:type II 3-dehydroquinate dehydratase [Facklamia lactis]MBG9979559.1 type II 3-dehydroquinate dehydratase [Facklamia lactis]MBG9985772.1 type II 3-dehydroquinate dehydratase [Facklamia lactis]
MNLLVINGPNLNLLGMREPKIYGHATYSDLVQLLEDWAQSAKVHLEIYQSNHEGQIIDKIQEAYYTCDGLVLNAAAYTHTSLAIHDALAAVQLPFVEVHISSVSLRESYRQWSYIENLALKTIEGQGFEGYLQALTFLKNYLSHSH